MKFKDLTEKQKNKFAKIYLDDDLGWEEKMRKLSKFIGNKSGRTVRTWAQKLDLTSKEVQEPKEYEEAKKRVFDKKKKRFIITWAQNNTPVHRKFLANIEAYAKYLDADIHVIAGRYKNPTSIWTNMQEEEERWSPYVKEYLDANRHDIHRYVTIMSDVKIHPTAVNPMTGLQAMSEENSCIFGSAKMQMETIPVLESAKPKMMLTTGACTVKNYTDSKAGKKGEFHHVLGFCIVEIKDKKTFFVRQVCADDDGNFSDLYNDVVFDGTLEKNEKGLHNIDKPYKLIGKSKITRVKEIEACVLGDLHVGHHDPAVLKATHTMLDKIKPKHVVLHDVFDGYSISHHDAKDPIAQYAKEFHGNNDLGKELDEMFEVLEDFDDRYDSIIVARANHDDFADRWVKNQDWKKQSTPKNYKLYSKFMGMMLTEAEENPFDQRGVIPMLINEKLPQFKTLGRRDSFKIAGWEVGLHGDIGSNGSRGSLLQYRKLNTKVIVGHYHSPGRKDGSLAVGTSTHLRVGYNMGPSSWLQSHVIIHKNGKAQHINFINGEFTTFE
jgi:hypothetical protein